MIQKSSTFAVVMALTAMCFGSISPAVAKGDNGQRVIESWVEEWDPLTQTWVRVSDLATTAQPIAGSVTTSMADDFESPLTNRYSPYIENRLLSGPTPQGLLKKPNDLNVIQYGPFRVLNEKRAAIVGPTDQFSPMWFETMMEQFPELEVLEMHEAPGTTNDIANLRVGRAIRAAGLRTHVPNGGSVRSGAVELFLAGTSQTMDPGALFAVHSWLDAYGREPDDFPSDHPSNRLYIDYYIEMGMTEQKALQFYALTNSVPHQSALWLRSDDMLPWINGN